MSRSSDIISSIHHLERKIEEYRNKIAKLEEKAELLRGKQEIINADFYEPEKSSDMTFSGAFLGRTESDTENLRTEATCRIDITQQELSEFIYAINRAIERLNELIEECEREISSLEDELSSLSEMDCNGVM